MGTCSAYTTDMSITEFGKDEAVFFKSIDVVTFSAVTFQLICEFRLARSHFYTDFVVVLNSLDILGGLS